MNFIKTTLLGGLFILLPLMLLWLGLQEIAGLLIAMATPIADLFPKGPFEDLSAPGLVAVLLIVGASFVLGLAARSYVLTRIGRQVENSILEKVPMYRMLKIMSGALLDTRGGAGGLRPNVGTTMTNCKSCNAGGNGGKGYIFLMDADGVVDGFFPSTSGTYPNHEYGVLTISEFDGTRFQASSAITELFAMPAADPPRQAPGSRPGSGFQAPTPAPAERRRRERRRSESRSLRLRCWPP